MLPVIVCIAKKEGDYIEEFVKYHLALGFKRIYLYDNEDKPTYASLLEKYKDKMKIIHMPHNNFHKGVQYIALDDFISKYLVKDKITHVAHIDIDEFIVLKKHKNIRAFIREYIVGDCQGIGMNWRFFGSAGQTEQTNVPLTMRFTMCSENGDKHIKTLFKTKKFLHYGSCNEVVLKKGYIKSTNKTIIHGPLNPNPDLSVIQLNHYKCKTLPEFKYIRTRGRADLIKTPPENVEESFKLYDCNEITDETAMKFYKKKCSKP